MLTIESLLRPPILFNRLRDACTEVSRKPAIHQAMNLFGRKIPLR
jgi:hypothetical protein